MVNRENEKIEGTNQKQMVGKAGGKVAEGGCRTKIGGERTENQ